MRSFPALWTQSAGIVQYRHLVISGFSTKCRYCSIPALCHFRFAYKFIFQTVISRIFHNFGSSSPNFKIFAFLETALKFISSLKLVRERGMKIEAATGRLNIPTYVGQVHF